MSEISWRIIDDKEYRYSQTIKKKDGNKLGKRKIAQRVKHIFEVRRYCDSIMMTDRYLQQDRTVGARACLFLPEL